MTRKDYKLIAEIINKRCPRDRKNKVILINGLMYVLKTDNIRFNTERFTKAYELDG